jgi:16S rRNA C967 or C1407 C5-methylase (RsmB/RsmF family)
MMQLDFYEVLHILLPRYLRRIDDGSPGDMEDLASRLSAKLNGEAVAIVKNTAGFLSVPGYVSIAEVDPVSSFGLYPMDIASAYAVMALDIQVNNAGIKVLDLCTCPGAKNQMIKEILDSKSSLLVGVDVSKPRLDVCRSLLHKIETRSFLENRRKANECGTIDFKMKLSRQLIFNCDGTKFHPLKSPGTLVFDSKLLQEEIEQVFLESGVARKRKNKSAKGREFKRLREVEKDLFRLGLGGFERYGDRDESASYSVNDDEYDADDEPDRRSRNLTVFDSDDNTDVSTTLLEGGSGRYTVADGFDYVLVDAECSHDGSYRHMRYIDKDADGNSSTKNRDTATPHKKDKTPEEYCDERADDQPVANGGPTVVKRNATASFSNKERMDSIQELQRSLLSNGFDLLKPGGFLVYSTCSLDERQNEDVVRWLLANNPQAQLVEIPAAIRRGADGTTASIAATAAGVSSSYDCSLSANSQETTSASSCLSAAQLASVAESENMEAPKAIAEEESGRSPRLMSGLELLTLNPEQLVDAVKPLTELQLHEISRRICVELAMRTSPPLMEGTLKGTARLAKEGGTSGIFIARLQKRD